MNKSRAYSLITVKSVDEEQRIITGLATTPMPDRVGDIVEPKGAKFKLPIPLLWQHKHDQPIGHVTSAKVTPEGILITAKLAAIPEPGKLKDRLDEAWQALKSGLVRGLSIGFRAIERSLTDEGGFHFTSWEWLELSAVTIPANAQASIQTVKLYDTAARTNLPLPVVKVGPATSSTPKPFDKETFDIWKATDEEIRAHPDWPAYFSEQKKTKPWLAEPEPNETFARIVLKGFRVRLKNQVRRKHLDQLDEDEPMSKRDVRSMIRYHLEREVQALTELQMTAFFRTVDLFRDNKKRIDESGIAYKGIWEEEKTYRRNAAVTHGGSLWIAKADTTGQVPGTSDAWQLAVKKGRDAKGSR